MSTNPLADKISTIAELENEISQRAHQIVIASNFQAWPGTTEKFYRFLPPNSQGIHACERVYHPGASRLTGYEDLCDLVYGGSEVVFELDPAHQQAVRFCEQVIATLYEDVAARKASDSPFAKNLILSTDWSIRDGMGPCVLPVPVVVGFTHAGNINTCKVQKPSIIWSKQWQLSIDPVDALVNRVREVIEKHSWPLKQDETNGYTPLTMDAWVDQALICLMIWVEKNRDLPSIALDELSCDRLPVIPIKEKLENCQIRDLCSQLTDRIHRKQLHEEWSKIFRAPASSMYDKASLSFGNPEKVMGDCWGYPFAFDLSFGNGVVKVRYEGGATLNNPAVEAPAVVTPAVPEPDVDPPLTLTEAMLFDLGQKCLNLDEATRKPPSHYAVLKAALVDGMNTYDMARAYKWPRKTAELRLKNIEAKLLSGTKIKYILVEPGIFKNVYAQLESARKHGANIYRPTMLDNTTGGDDDDSNQE